VAAVIKPTALSQTQLFRDDLVRVIEREIAILVEVKKLFATNKSAKELKDYNKLVNRIDDLKAFLNKIIQLRISEFNSEKILEQINLIQEELKEYIQNHLKQAASFQNLEEYNNHLRQVMQEQLKKMESIKTAYEKELSDTRKETSYWVDARTNTRIKADIVLQDAFTELSKVNLIREVNVGKKSISYQQSDLINHIQNKIRNKVVDGTLHGENLASVILHESKIFLRNETKNVDVDENDFEKFSQREAANVIKLLANSSKAPQMIKLFSQLAHQDSKIDALKKKEEHLVNSIEVASNQISDMKSSIDNIINKSSDLNFSTAQTFEATKNVIEQAIPLINQHTADLNSFQMEETFKIKEDADDDFGDAELIDIEQNNVVNIDPSLSSQAGLERFFRAHPADENQSNERNANQVDEEQQPKSYEESKNDKSPPVEPNLPEYEANQPDQKPEVREADEDKSQNVDEKKDDDEKDAQDNRPKRPGR
jgi:translation initiation factor 2B subunit (eIF-2B alpha/beta/delta family)